MTEQQELLRKIIGEQNFTALCRLCGGNKVKIPSETTARLCSPDIQDALEDKFYSQWVCIPPYPLFISSVIRDECTLLSTRGMSIKELSVKYGVTIETVRKWLK